MLLSLKFFALIQALEFKCFQHGVFQKKRASSGIDEAALENLCG